VPRRERPADPTDRWVRRLAAAAVLAAGIVLLILANSWRDLEAVVSAHAIALITGQTTQTVPGRPEIILFQDTTVQSIFVLTSECTVAYLMVALLVGTAPLLLLRKLAPSRTLVAVTVALSLLVIANLARLTAIGATVSELGRDPGMTIAHTYLGSLLTVVGTCAAGVAFAAVLIGRPERRATRRLTAV
jgi:exosortase/archaeosortase family protein